MSQISPEGLAFTFITTITDWPESSTEQELLGTACENCITKSFKLFYSIFAIDTPNKSFPSFDDTLPFVHVLYKKFTPRPDLLPLAFRTTCHPIVVFNLPAGDC